MKRLWRLAIRLYPPAWRARYEAELEALMEDAGSGWKDVFNVVRGGIAMYLETSWRITAAAALAGLVFGAAASFAIPRQFISSALVRLPESPDQAVSRAAATEKIEALRQRHGLGATPVEEIAKSIFFGERRNGMMRVSFMDADPRRAQAVTSDLTGLLLAEAPGASVADSASLPRMPVKPNRAVMAGLGLAAGAVIGLVAARFRKRPTRVHP